MLPGALEIVLPVDYEILGKCTYVRKSTDGVAHFGTPIFSLEGAVKCYLAFHISRCLSLVCCCSLSHKYNNIVVSNCAFISLILVNYYYSFLG